MNAKRVAFKYPLDRRPPRLTPGTKAALEAVFGKIQYTANPPRKKTEPAPTTDAK